jgi:hypothetical protein
VELPEGSGRDPERLRGEPSTLLVRDVERHPARPRPGRIRLGEARRRLRRGRRGERVRGPGRRGLLGRDRRRLRPRRHAAGPPPAGRRGPAPGRSAGRRSRPRVPGERTRRGARLRGRGVARRARRAAPGPGLLGPRDLRGDAGGRLRLPRRRGAGHPPQAPRSPPRSRRDGVRRGVGRVRRNAAASPPLPAGRRLRVGDAAPGGAHVSRPRGRRRDAGLPGGRAPGPHPRLQQVAGDGRGAARRDRRADLPHAMGDRGRGDRGRGPDRRPRRPARPPALAASPAPGAEGRGGRSRGRAGRDPGARGDERRGAGREPDRAPRGERVPARHPDRGARGPRAGRRAS